MTVTVVTRWTTPNVAATTELVKRAKAIWLKHGAQELRFSQIFTGEFTGQYIVAVFFADMAAYARTSASGAADMQPIFAEAAKMGSVLQEREIVVGIDL